jgi:hypothetical protein
MSVQERRDADAEPPRTPDGDDSRSAPTDRQVRALKAESHLLVYPDDPEAPLDCEVAVYSDGRRHIVNLDVGFCDCEDAHYNLDTDEECYHEARARYATEGLPWWVNADAVDPFFRSLVDDAEVSA